MAVADPITKFPEKVLKSLRKLKISDTDIDFVLHGTIPPKISWVEIKKMLSASDYDKQWLPTLRDKLVERAETKGELEQTFRIIKEDSNLRFRLFVKYSEYITKHPKEVSIATEYALFGEYIFSYDSLFYTILNNVCAKKKTTDELGRLYELCPAGSEYEHASLLVWRDFQLGKVPYKKSFKRPKVVDMALKGTEEDKKLEPVRMNLLKEFSRMYTNRSYELMRMRYKLLRKILYTYHETVWYY